MKARVSAIIVLLFLSSMAAAQGRQFNITGAGARAAGMGNAFIGVADDATAIVWNPAGLAQLERMEVSAVGRYVWETYDITWPDDPDAKRSWPQQHPSFNFGSFAVPFSVGDSKGVIAAAYQRQLDFYTKFGSDWFSWEETGGADAISPGVALGIGSIFSLGFVTNIWIGQDEYDIDMQTYGYKAEGTISGLNFLAGLLVDLNGLKSPVPIKFGATVRTPFDLEMDFDEVAWEKNQSGVITNTKRPYTQTLEVPIMVGFGASGRPTENLTVAVDYEIRKFKDAKAITERKQTTGSYKDTSFLSDSRDDLNQFRVGLEYLFVSRGGVIPIRVGYFTAPTLQANEDQDPITMETKPTDQVIGNGFSVGTGFIGGTFAFDLSFSYTMWEEKLTEKGKTSRESDIRDMNLTGSVIIYF